MVKLLLAVIFLLAFLLSTKINFASADLGRHLKNGELILTTFSIPKTNLYSYTFPDYPFVNHHWGSGVIFFVVKQLFGFTGLSAFSVFLALVTFFLFFDMARRQGGWGQAILSSVIFLPLLASRVEIRPELYSYLFSAIFLWLLLAVAEKRIAFAWLWLLPGLMILWVNLHVYFFLGLVILAIFTATQPLRDWPRWLGLGVVTGLAGLLNPFGLAGWLYPLKILSEMGYPLLENQTFWFLDKVIDYVPSFYFKIGLLFLLVSWLFRLGRRDYRHLIGEVLFSVLVVFLGLKAVRNYAFFGFLALWLTSRNFKSLRLLASPWLVGGAGFLVLLFFFMAKAPYWLGRDYGWGLDPAVLKGTAFFNHQGLKGPIFNNYDVGGYLIYGLYPQEKVYTDNRPEAYPLDFFQQAYILPQQDRTKWAELEAQHRFQTIFFYRHDLTPWGQQFLIDRSRDNFWQLVFADDYTVIFVKQPIEEKRGEGEGTEKN